MREKVGYGRRLRTYRSRRRTNVTRSVEGCHDDDVVDAVGEAFEISLRGGSIGDFDRFESLIDLRNAAAAQRHAAFAVAGARARERGVISGRPVVAGGRRYGGRASVDDSRTPGEIHTVARAH